MTHTPRTQTGRPERSGRCGQQAGDKLPRQRLQLHVLRVRSKQCRTCAALKRLIFHMIALRLASYFALPVLCWMSALAVCSGTCDMQVTETSRHSFLCAARQPWPSVSKLECHMKAKECHSI